VRILTIIKQVPDSNAHIKVLGDGSGIDTTGLKMVCDPFDEFGIELAVQTREKRKDVEEIVAMLLGPDKAAETLRVALAMGADRGVHICDDALISQDEQFIAQVLAAAIKKEGVTFDLIVRGKQTIDLDSGETGPALAERLGLPHVAAITALDVSADGKTFKACRRIEGAEEVVEGSLPAVLTIEKGLVEPRYPSLPNLMKAKKKPVTRLTSADLGGLNKESRGCRFIEGEPPQVAKELVRLLREEAKVL